MAKKVPSPSQQQMENSLNPKNQTHLQLKDEMGNFRYKRTTSKDIEGKIEKNISEFPLFE
jgi:hypothetical protein